MDNLDKRHFIKRHEKTIRPLVGESGVFDSIGTKAEQTGDADTVLRAFETRVRHYERSDAAFNAKRVLLEAGQPSTTNVVEPLTRLLEADPHCKEITLLTESVANKRFDTGNEPFEEIHSGGDVPVLADIPAGPYDSVLVLDEPRDSVAPMLLESAKPVFGARSLYFFSQQLFDTKWKDAFEQVDAVFTSDEFTAGLTRAVFAEKDISIVVTGSPLIDNLDVSQADTLRKQGREKLAINSDAIVAYHSSIVPGTFAAQEESENLNDRTYTETLKGIVSTANANPQRSFVLLTRMHPRMKGTYAFPTYAEPLPENLRVLDGDSISYDEAMYTSDLIGCNPLSTEVMLASYRGRKAFVYGYSGEGQFEQIIQTMYGSEGAAFLKNNDRVAFAESSEQVAALVATASPISPLENSHPNALERIKGILLSDA